MTHYEQKESIEVGSLNPDRVLVTTGSSGGFLLVFNACFDAGDTVAVSKPNSFEKLLTNC